MKLSHDPVAERLQFQSFSFNPKTGVLKIKGGGELFMEHRLRDLFLILLENKYEFLSKKQLMELAWKGTIVSDQSVAKAISDLRKFFTKNGIEDVRITTVRKLGYRLEILEVSNSRMHRLMKLIPYSVAAAILLIFLFMHH